MLCCVPKRLADGGPFYDEAPTTPLSVDEIQFELYPEEDAPPPILLPCAICARTFMPQSLEKHARICERAAAKKRKPFDSAKQRIQGTELAEFLPKQETRRHQDERGRTVSPTWKKTHDDFLRVIREARGEVMNSYKQCNSLNSSGAPTRANEKGTCPTCNRRFGIKAYDRHVAWCKDRVITVPVNPAVNLAKERLEARMRYKAPALKNRRAATREKYSPTSTGNQCKTSLSAPALVKPKESVSLPNCRESPSKQKAALVRRPGQLKESPISSGPMKSRLSDRTNKPAEDHDHEYLPKILCRPPHISPLSCHPPYISVPFLRPKISESVFSNEIVSSNSTRRQSDQNGMIPRRIANDEAQNRKIRIAKTQKNIVSVRSCGNPRLNDVTVNDKILGVTVRSCKIYKDSQKNNQLVTWKQISRKSSPPAADSVINYNFPQEFQLLNLDRQHDEEGEIDTVTNENKTEKDSSIVNNESNSKLKIYELNEVDDNHISWLDNIQNLNQTYLIRDSEDIEQSEIFQSKWGLIRHSPRMEFYFKDTREVEVCEANEKKLKKNTKVNDEEIRVAKHIIEELKINNENKEYNSNVNSQHKVKVSGHRTGEIRSDSEDEKNIQKTNNIDIANWTKLHVNETHAKDEQITMDEDITKAKEIFEEIKNPLSDISQNLFDPHDHKSSALDIAYLAVLDAAPVGYEKSSSKEFKIDSIDNDLPSNNIPFYSKHKDQVLRFDNRSDLMLSDNFIDQNQDCNMYSEDDISQYKSDTYRNKAKEHFNNGDFENDSKETDCNLNDDLNIKIEIFVRLMDKVKVMTGKNSRKVHDKRVNSDVDYGDCNIIAKHNTRGDDDLESSIMLKDDVVEESRFCHEQVVPDASVNLSKCVTSLTRRSVRERPRNSAEIMHKVKGSMNLLRDSTDSLISSVEFVEFKRIEQSVANRNHEREIIKINRPNRRNRMREMLPDIAGEPMETRENGERSVDQIYWKRVSKISRNRLISLDPSCHVKYKLAKRNPRVRILPPIPSSPLTQPRRIELATRPAWCNYVRRRPDFNLVLKARTGTCKDYDPFLLAEQQMNDLLSDTSDQSMTDSPKPQTRDNLYPLSHSSAFVKYPRQTSPINPDKRTSLIAPPSEFDDLISDFSSDSTETNSISREVFLKDLGDKNMTDLSGLKPVRELGRRLIIDKTKALGGDLIEERRGVVGSADRARKNHDTFMPKIVPKVTRPLVNRSNSIRVSSAPRSNASSDRKASGDVRKAAAKSIESRRSSDQSFNHRNNNYSSLSGSNLSLSSIVSSEMDIKRSNSMFDELMTSLEEDISFPTLQSFLNNESFDVSSSMLGDGQRNGIISDEELFSPDSYKPQDHSKLSNDSAYSSLNRKYSHHGRSTNDVIGRLDEDATRNETPSQMNKYKMSKFCHECGLRFPENAKFCCECGVRRLAL